MSEDARTLLRSGELPAALAQVKQDVRRAPGDARQRTFLFQLFCVTGEWDRALTQLTAAAELDPAAAPMAETYRALIRCELLRAKVFAGERTPTVFGRPEPWMSLLIQAGRDLAAGRAAEAAALRDDAFEQAPETQGTLDGGAFAWIADADQRLGPMLEAMVEGKYYWVPFQRLGAIVLDAPTDLRDQVWMPAQFTWSNGGEVVGFIPTRYPGSERAAELALARRTEWSDRAGWATGLGQRMLATDSGEFALMDIRRIDFAGAPAAAG